MILRCKKCCRFRRGGVYFTRWTPGRSIHKVWLKICESCHLKKDEEAILVSDREV